MRCEKCGKENVDGARYCAQCGSPIPQGLRHGMPVRGWLVATGVLATIVAVLVALIVMPRPMSSGLNDSPAQEAMASDPRPKERRAGGDDAAAGAGGKGATDKGASGTSDKGAPSASDKGASGTSDGIVGREAGDEGPEAQSASSTGAPYTLAGVVRVHAEDVGGRTIAIASVVLDEPIWFQDDYKGVYDGEAQEVALSTSDSDSYEDWAQYKGRRIVVECDGLRGAFHDAAFYNVDAITLGEVRLVEAEELATEEDIDGDRAADVVHLDGCDLIIPDAWRGKVVQGNRYGDVTLEWNGFSMLNVRQCTPDDFLKVDRQVGTVELENGGAAIIKPGSDHSFDAEVTYGGGKGLMVYLFAYSDDLAWFFSRGDDECREYFALQAAATGLTTDDDPDEVAIACLKACVQNLRFEGE